MPNFWLEINLLFQTLRKAPCIVECFYSCNNVCTKTGFMICNTRFLYQVWQCLCKPSKVNAMENIFYKNQAKFSWKVLYLFLLNSSVENVKGSNQFEIEPGLTIVQLNGNEALPNSPIFRNQCLNCQIASNPIRSQWRVWRVFRTNRDFTHIHAVSHYLSIQIQLCNQR